MLLDAQNTPGLERFEARRQCLLGIARIHPVMEIAECQHEIRGPGRCDIKMAGAQGGLVNCAEAIFLSGNSRAPMLHGLVLLGTTGSGLRDVVRTSLSKIRPQDLGPVAAAGP